MTAVLVVAKSPVPGQAKTRLSPPATPEQGARIAWASLVDTLAAVRRTPGVRRAVALTGPLHEAVAPVPLRGFAVRPQRGADFAERLANAHLDVGGAVFQIGMDTPQVTPELLAASVEVLGSAQAVLGLAQDGGWWGLGVREARWASVLRGVPMSREDTGERTLAALRSAGLTVALLPVLSDVDTMADAVAVARDLPGSAFARAVAAVTEVAGVAGVRS
ncbi:glycosyltransferase A (GT-A) superfamily protein (DUF2064 family) [Crossiella equi]|uniref:Glycosyltransferase A (GT-A) superfamily protein (DUF2064 family) n=1 Tax=Crossiella equi TaxID=130796 RepID=A0ABS5A8Y0_9PSEU|nr:TIGR04282 family arsenosugar biosynthesis glycosyltransferase [Crossiella equi]MBP2472776.1 glycosyltransferase A (GT-A) superfamily protein (DUF2064 family) [Crossiella equi]